MQSQNSYYSFLDNLDQCVNISQTKDLCQKYLHSYGGGVFKYSWQPPEICNRSDSVNFSVCPNTWETRYEEERYEKIDPKLHYCKTHHRAIDWKEHQQIYFQSNEPINIQQKQYWEDTIDSEMKNGVIIPIRGIGGSIGMFCVGTDDHDVSDRLPVFEAWAMHLQTHIEQLYTETQLTSSLSDREKEILKWTVIGKTADEIAQILSISNNTVIFHLKSLRGKLNVTNKHQLIARAFSLRLVNW